MRDIILTAVLITVTFVIGFCAGFFLSAARNLAEAML